ncbi:MAG: glycosyltransferase family 9 protein, partial [Candidatus Aegiribacteria sp.]|nr:glycosyltransferase family 9 protein [Candidatus Aegiribacteria sp.]
SGKAVALEPSVEPEGSPHTAFFAGARYGSAKMWPRFPELARRIYETTGLPSVFYGSPEEETVLREISSDVPLSEVRTDLTLSGLASSLLAAELAAGNDSGGVHVSALLGIPTVTVFGSTSPLWTAPRGRFAVAVNTERECSPCFRRKCPDGIPECLHDISTDEVFSACMELMSRVSDG